MNAPSVSRVDTVFLPVNDLERATHWYGQSLGLAVRERFDNYAVLEAGETPLTLYRPEDGFAPYERPAFNLYAADIEAAHRRLQAAGARVTPIREMQGRPGGRPQVRWFDFRDPDGNALSVCCWPQS